jgi:hypothetical protein
MYDIAVPGPLPAVSALLTGNPQPTTPLIETAPSRHRTAGII